MNIGLFSQKINYNVAGIYIWPKPDSEENNMYSIYLSVLISTQSAYYW